MKQLIRLFTACAAVMVATAAWAITWTGKGTDNKWSTAANWDASRAPVNGDEVTFAANTTATIDMEGGTYSVNKLNLTTAGLDITLTNSATLKINDSVTLSGSGKLTLDGVTVSESGAVTLGKSMTLTLTNAAKYATKTDKYITNTSGGSIIVQDGSTLSGKYITHKVGTLSVTGGSTLSFNYVTQTSGTLSLEGGSTLTATGGDNTFGGEVIVDDSTLTLKKAIVSNGGKITLRGTTPKITCSSDFVGASGAAGTLAFVVPAGGYATAPVQTSTTFGSTASQLAISVSADSPAKYMAETLADIPLVTAKAVTAEAETVSLTAGVVAGTLPQKTDSLSIGATSVTASLSGSRITLQEIIKKDDATNKSAWKGIDLAIPAATADRKLYAVWGAADAGTTPESWDNHDEGPSTVAADLKLAYYSLENKTDWGSDAFKYIRFYVELADGTRIWSQAMPWHEIDNIAFTGAPSLDGTGGDSLVVSGALSRFPYPAESCALQVLVGESADSLAAWTGATATLTRDGLGYAFTLCETDATQPRYLKPGATYYVAVEATANDATVRSDVAEVTMAGAPTLVVSASASVKTATFTARLADVGMNGSAVVTLWYRLKGATEWISSGVSQTVTDTAKFTFTYEFPEYEKTYEWELRAVSTSKGAGTTAEASTTTDDGAKTLNTTDVASVTYTWTGNAGNGLWSDKGNWSNNKGGVCLGYPHCSSSLAVFPAMDSDVTVTLTEAMTITTLNLSAVKKGLTFKNGAATRDGSKLSVSNSFKPPTTSGASWTLDGVAFYLGNGSITVSAGVTLSLLNEAYLTINDSNKLNNFAGGTVILRGRSTFQGASYYWGHADGLTIIDNSTLSLLSYFAWSATGGTVRFEGKAPMVKFRANNYIWGTAGSLAGTWVFSIPEGGYDKAPIQAICTNSKIGNKNTTSKLTIKIDPNSPAKAAGETLTATPLITTTSGIDTNVVLKGELPQATDAFVWGTDATPKTLGVSLSGSYFTTTVDKTDTAWNGVDLTDIPTADTRTVYIAWGAEDGGTDAANWDHVESLGALASDATSYSYKFADQTAAMTSGNAKWGDAAFRAVRFYIDDSTTTRWSPVTEWAPLNAPEFANEGELALDGTGADTIRISGELAKFSGESCSLRVLVGDNNEELERVFETSEIDGDATIPASAESKKFEISVCEKDVNSARYLKPGKSYYVAVEATSDGVTTRSEVGYVTMASNTGCSIAAFTMGSNRLQVTITNQLSVVGMNAATYTVWAAPANDAAQLVQLEGIEWQVSDTEVHVNVITLPEYDRAYYLQLRAQCISAGGTVTNATVSSTKLTTARSCTPTDATTYTWTGAKQDGDWTNKGNWSDDQDGDCVGYPNSSSATAVFPANTDVTITLAGAQKAAKLDLSAENVNLTFKRAAGDETEVNLAVTSALDLSGEGGSVTFDGVGVTLAPAAAVPVGKGRNLAVVNGANVKVTTGVGIGGISPSEGGEVRIANGATFECGTYNCGPHDIEIDNATWNIRAGFRMQCTNLVNFVFRGEAPHFNFTTANGYFCGAGTKNPSNVNFEFVVPEGGYQEAPFCGPDTTAWTIPLGNFRSGNNPVDYGGTFTVNVSKDSPAKIEGETVDAMTLISWEAQSIVTSRFVPGSVPQASYDKFAWGTGNKTLNVSLSNAYITVSEVLKSGAWNALDVKTTTPSAENRKVYVAYGAKNAGEKLADWDYHPETEVVTLAPLASEFTFSLGSLTGDVAWGSEKNKVIRFYYLDDDGEPVWSQTTYWRSLTKPAVSDVEADGAGGDTLVVKGTLEAFAGTTCSLKVLVGETADFDAATWWTWEGMDGATMDAAGGEFSFTLCQGEKEGRLLVPGKTYYVVVEGTSANGETGTSEVVEVAMAAPGVTFDGNPSGSVVRDTVTVTAKFEDLGMTPELTKVSFWYGTNKTDVAEFEESGDVTDVADTEKFTLANCALPTIATAGEASFYWQLRATNVSAGGTVTNVTESAVMGPVTTKDTTTYTWSGRGTPGVWADKDNWDAGENSGDCLGYPQSANATVAFEEGADVTITLAAQQTIAKLDLSAANVKVTFTGAEGLSTNDTKLTVNAWDITGEGNTLKLDHAALCLYPNEDVRTDLGKDSTIELVNGSDLWYRQNFGNVNGGHLLLSGDSTFRCYRYYFGDANGSTVINDATMNVGRTGYFSDGAKIRFEGSHPLMYFGASYFGGKGTAHLEFMVPVGGYATVPMQCVSNGAQTFGYYDGTTTGTVYIDVPANAPAKVYGKLCRTTLIKWPKNGINRAYAKNGTLPSARHDKFIGVDASGADLAADATANPISLDVLLAPPPGFLLIIR